MKSFINIIIILVEIIHNINDLVAQSISDDNQFIIRDSERIHVKKCEEYLILIQNYYKNNNIPLSPGAISGGVRAIPKEFPHMALLGYNEGGLNISWKCGGSLISDRYILTAAHCLITRHPLERIRLGELDYNSNMDDALPEDYGYDDKIIHPNYNNHNKYNDIGLIKLDRNVNFNEYIYPACLPNTFIQYNGSYIETGWGATNSILKSSNIYSSHLLKVTLKVYNYNDCIKIHTQIGYQKHIQNAIQFCAGSNIDNKDTCGGDSGGPIQIYHNCNGFCMYMIYGITSYGPPCGYQIPGFYTKVFPYINWIESIVW